MPRWWDGEDDAASVVRWVGESGERYVSCYTAEDEFDLLRDLSARELGSAFVWRGTVKVTGETALAELVVVFGEE